jgi:restriction system protein
MVSFYLSNNELICILSEAAGFKTGVALNKDNLLQLFPNESRYKELLSIDNSQYVRLRSEEIEEIFTQILYSLGNIEYSAPISSTMRLRQKYKDDRDLAIIYESILKLFIKHLRLEIDKAEKEGGKMLDPTEFMTEASQQFGRVGLEISYELIEGNTEDLHSKLSGLRRFKWENTVELETLFTSESLESKYGRFIDQRFIDYLSRNLDRLGEIHWRKFEGLTAEYFHREGYIVEIAKGRNDGGIDIRVWKDKALSDDPPLILVQCKRQKEKIEKAVVKALWADLQHEKAESGLIVTTSSISIGALKDCTVRGYNIQQKNKKDISNWLESMRTIGNGVFMGE